MKKIKTYIIHILGGFTPEEFKNSFLGEAAQEKYDEGAQYIISVIHMKLASMNGMDAHDWCKEAWEFVEHLHKRYQK